MANFTRVRTMRVWYNLATYALTGPVFAIAGLVKVYRLAHRLPAKTDNLGNRFQPHALAIKGDDLPALLVESFRRNAPIQFYFVFHAA